LEKTKLWQGQQYREIWDRRNSGKAGWSNR